MYMKTKIELRWVPCPLIICQIFLQLHWSPPMVKSIDCYCGVLFVAFQQGFNMEKLWNTSSAANAFCLFHGTWRDLYFWGFFMQSDDLKWVGVDTDLHFIQNLNKKITK